jgi:5-methylcytosine-specific restriction endonuclease McrA
MAKRKKPDKYRACPKCGEVKLMTRHHIYPRRVYGQHYNSRVFMLCWDCHCALEKRIPYAPIPHHHYPAILITFLLEGNHAR